MKCSLSVCDNDVFKLFLKIKLFLWGNGETEINRNGKGGLRKNLGRRGFAMVRGTNRTDVRTSAGMETGNLAERIWDGVHVRTPFSLLCIAKALGSIKILFSSPLKSSGVWGDPECSGDSSLPVPCPSVLLCTSRCRQASWRTSLFGESLTPKHLNTGIMEWR